VTLLALGVLAGIVGAFFVLPRIRAPIETGQKPSYEEVGVGWFIPILGMPAGSNFSPYRLSLYEKFFVISTITKHIGSYADIVWLKRGKLNQLSFMLTGDRKLTLLLPRDSTTIIDLFKAKGVPVQ